MTSKTRREMVITWHERGYSVTETSRLLKIPLDEVCDIIRTGDGHPKPPGKPEFIAPPMF